MSASYERRKTIFFLVEVSFVYVRVKEEKDKNEVPTLTYLINYDGDKIKIRTSLETELYVTNIRLKQIRDEHQFKRSSQRSCLSQIPLRHLRILSVWLQYVVVK